MEVREQDDDGTRRYEREMPLPAQFEHLQAEFAPQMKVALGTNRKLAVLLACLALLLVVQGSVSWYIWTKTSARAAAKAAARAAAAGAAHAEL